MKTRIITLTAAALMGLGSLSLHGVATAHSPAADTTTTERLVFSTDAPVSAAQNVKAQVGLGLGRRIFRRVTTSEEDRRLKSKYGAENLDRDVPSLLTDTQTPHQNSMGITGTVDTFDAEALLTSITKMIDGRSQQEQLLFMEAFFRVAITDRCDSTGQYQDNGWDNRTSRRIYRNRRFRECMSSSQRATYYAEFAEIFVAEQRMDTSRAYVASDAFGSWTGGRSQRESYVRFINLYAHTMNGKSADYILHRNRDIMTGNAVSFHGRRF